MCHIGPPENLTKPMFHIWLRSDFNHLRYWLWIFFGATNLASLEFLTWEDGWYKANNITYLEIDFALEILEMSLLMMSLKSLFTMNLNVSTFYYVMNKSKCNCFIGNLNVIKRQNQFFMLIFQFHKLLSFYYCHIIYV